MNSFTTTVFGDDLERAHAFYADFLGFDVLDRQDGRQLTFGSRSVPRRDVTVVRGAGCPPDPDGAARRHRVKISVELPDPDDLYRRALRDNVTVTRSPTGDGALTVLDPHGVAVEVTSGRADDRAKQNRPGLGYQGTSDRGQTRPPGDTIPPALMTLRTLMDSTTPWALRVAVTLGIPDLIADRVTGADDLAARAGANPDAVRRLLRHLVFKGVFAEPEPGVYALTPLSELLRAGHPAGMAGWLDINGAAAHWSRTYVDMLMAVRTGNPVYEQTYGMSFWDDLARHEHLSDSFDALMAQQARWSAGLIADAYDWQNVGHVLDVGGGTGTLLAAILHANSHLRGTLVDRPDTTAAAAAWFRELGLADRCDVHPGSFFEPLPGGGDVYVVANVLHDWGDPEATAILRRCAEAAGGDGRVLIVEGIIGGGGDQSFVAELDLLMLVAFGGRERSATQFSAMAQTAGLTICSIHETASGMSLIEALPS